MKQKELKKILSYDKETGVFTWKINISRKVRKGDIAGMVNSEGYRRIGIKGKSYLSHRLAWLYEYGHFPKNETDHINHYKTDNKICNLRDVTGQENQKNELLTKRNTSGTVGVGRFKSKWYARIGVNRKTISLGYFKDIKDAIRIRKNAEITYGFHLNHGKQGT